MWMMAAAIGMSLVSTAVGAKAASDKGIAEQNALNSQGTAAYRAAAEAETQAKEVSLQAEQAEATRMAQLSSMIGANAARAAAAGITSDSASLQAIEEHNRTMAGRDIANIAYNGQSQAARLRRQAKYGREAGETYQAAGLEARSAANTAMWGTIFKGATSLAMYGSIPGLGGTTGAGGAPGVAASAGGAGARPV